MKLVFVTKARHAFSLLEMLAIVLIVGVLVAIIFSAFTKIRKSAQDAGCISNLRQIGVGVIRFAADHNGALPYYKNVVAGQFPTPDWWKFNEWAYQYLDGNQSLGRIFRCPADATPLTAANYSGGSKPYMLYCSYSCSMDYIMYWENGAPPIATATSNKKSRYIYLSEVTNKMLFFDGVTLPSGYGVIGNLGDSTTSPASGVNAIVSDRHHGGTEGLFGDGAVRWISKTELLNDPVQTDQSLFSRPYP